MEKRAVERHDRNRKQRKKQQRQQKEQKRNLIITVIVMVVIIVIITGISSCVANWTDKTNNHTQPSDNNISFFQTATENPNNIPDNGDDGYYVNNNHVFVWNEQAFECFNADNKNAVAYASLINHCSQRLPETVKNVYSTVIPTHIAFGLPSRLQRAVQSTSQQDYIAEIYSRYDKSVTSVNIFSTLDKHKIEYIFFNTDHRWTTLGSYYAYEQFCDCVGLKTKSLADFQYTDFSPFIGSLYSVTNLEILKNNADTLRYYNIGKNYTVRIQKNKNDSLKSYDSIYNEKNKSYSLFLYGDNPVTKIVCKDYENDSNLLIVKDSYANNFVPWLIGHYHEIHVIDFSTYEGNIPYYCKNNNITSVLFMNDVMSSINTFQLENIGNMF